MYSNCIFCHANLGANEAIEHFPVSADAWRSTPRRDAYGWYAGGASDGISRRSRIFSCHLTSGDFGIRATIEMMALGAKTRTAARRYETCRGNRRKSASSKLRSASR